MKSDSQKEAGAKILNEYGQFLKKQCQDFMLLTKLEPQDVNKTFQPITITLKPNEFMNTIDLVSSDNTLMTKILGVLSSLCVEVVNLREEAYESHFPFLAVYDEYNISSVSTQMEAICMLNAFVIRCDEVLRNLCSQVFALYVEDVINLNGIQLHYIINHIGELLTVIVLTELLISNTSLGQKWQKYCKDLKNFSQTNENVNLSEARLKSVQGAINKIGIKLFADNIVQSCLEGLLTLKQENTSKKSTGLSNELTQYLRAAITNLDKLVQENAQCATMYKCIKINCLFVLNANLYGVNDKKMFKVMMELNAKAHSIPIGGTAVWYPEQFLQRFLPSLCTSYGKLPQTMFKARQNYISSKKAALAREVTLIQAACTQWIIKVDDFFGPKHVQLNASQMSQHSKTILAGLEIASQLRYTILTFINLHLSLGMPLSRAMLMVIFESIDVLKDIQNAIQRNSSNIVISINMIVQHLTFQATSSVLEVKKHLMTDKSYGNQRLDELTCIVIAEKTLKGAATIERLVAANVALNFIPASTYEEDVYARLGILFEKVQTLTNFKTLIGNICDCSWLLWHQNIIPIYLQQNFTVELNSLRLKYFLMALDDCMKMLHKTDKQFGCDRSQDFLNNMKVLIDVNVLRSFSQQLETNLRLHTHSHLQLDVVNPFTMEMAKKVLLTIDNLKLMHLYLSVVPSVEHYLSTMYYNLTTVVLSDWKTYGEMRQMAKFKFHLETVQDHLPTQTLEQGLDVLEIMRNIHIFVSKYLYNLNNQIFVEKSSNNKHLNSINIRHIANSIRTHGTGIMNTTVNFTYQFLKKKFFTFSQFLYDEHIKSRLIKDLRFFKENASASGNMYPYRNADKFNKGIRSLGLAEDGQTYLDLFRDLISQIGNAMGYVRMIRSGGRHCCADATVFLPTLDETKSFKTLSEECGLKQVVLESAEGLDLSIDSLISNFMQRTEYFKLLVEVFSPTFRNPKNVHLKNFFIIVPPLTLNFVEHMILSKDKMTKKNKVGAAFTDDGFAMGVAYILKLLDQDSSFESLNWFDSVWKHFEEEKQALEDQKSKGTLQLQQALALTEKKLKTLEQEFQLLYYSLTSARIFFR